MIGGSSRWEFVDRVEQNLGKRGFGSVRSVAFMNVPVLDRTGKWSRMTGKCGGEGGGVAVDESVVYHFLKWTETGNPSTDETRDMW